MGRKAFILHSFFLQISGNDCEKYSNFLEFVVLIDFYDPVNDFIEICLTNFIRFIQQSRRLGYFFPCWFIYKQTTILWQTSIIVVFYKLKYKTYFNFRCKLWK